MSKSLCLLLIFCAQNLLAFDNTISTGAPVAEDRFLPENLSLDLAQELSSDFETNLDGDTNLTSSTGLTLGIKLEKERSLTIASSFENNINTEEAGDLTNLSLQLVDRSRKIGKTTSYSNSLIANAPTSRRDREDTSFRSALTYKPSFSLSFEERALPLVVSLSPSLRRNFHQYSTNYQSRYNVEYSLGTSIGAVYKYSDRLSLNVEATYSILRTYNGINKGRFGLSEKVSFKLDEGFNFAIGHRNGGDTLATDGSSNLGLYNAIDSVFFTSLSMSI